MKKIYGMALLALVIVAAGCSRKEEAASVQEKDAAAKAAQKVLETVEIDPTRLVAFQPLPSEAPSESNPLTEDKITLGRKLYFDPRLSKNHDISCNSCHGLDTYGVDNKALSDGHRDLKGDRNSPTVYNAALHMVQFWDGRALDVEEQAKGPVLNPVEMAMPDEARVVDTLRSIPQYVELFGKAFPDEEDPVSFDNMANAIGAFERKLITPSRWDDFLKGDKDALSVAEKKGFNTFVESGCMACHAGANLGGHMYQKAGLIKPWPNDKDLGRFDVTGEESDKFMFKVPSLRNIEKTAPYFHDGSVESLDEAIQVMAVHQVGKELSADEVKSIATFLKALTGELPTDYIKEPELPPSTDSTPKPDPS